MHSQTGSGLQEFRPKTVTTSVSSSRSPAGYARFTAICAVVPPVASTIGWKASVAISAATVRAAMPPSSHRLERNESVRDRASSRSAV